MSISLRTLLFAVALLSTVSAVMARSSDLAVPIDNTPMASPDQISNSPDSGKKFWEKLERNGN